MWAMFIILIHKKTCSYMQYNTDFDLNVNVACSLELYPISCLDKDSFFYFI